MSNYGSLVVSCFGGVNDAGSLLRIKDVLRLVPVGRSTLWAWVKAGRFPAPIKLSPKCTVWRAEDLALFIKHGGWTRGV
jgi:predicted DNA-binding transcriptional regulator AlpA